MLKVLKNLKKSFWSVVVIVILLCVQAKADLALPDYTSRIVNVGIQAGGIETAVPEVISKENMDAILMFSDKDDEILNNYTLLKTDLNNYEQKVVKKYFGEDYKVEADTIYIANDIEEAKREELETTLSTPLMELMTISNEETANKIKEQMMVNMPEAQKPFMEKMSLMEILQKMPEEQRDEMLKQFTEKITSMTDSIRKQAAIGAVKEVYKNLEIDTDKIQNDYILYTGIEMLGVALITMVSAVLIMLFSSRVAAKLGRTLREKVFVKVLKFTRKELNEFGTASLITRSTNDIQQIQQLITMLFRVVVYAPIIGIGGFLKVLTNSNNTMAWIIGVAILAILFVVGTLFIIAMPKFKKLQELTDKLNLVSREILTGLPVIRAFNQEKREEKRFDDANKDLMKTNVFVNRAMSMMMPLLMFIMNSIMLLVIWVGGHGVDEGIMQVGDMMAFIQYTMQIVMSFLMISMISIMLPRASVSANRINEVLETEPNIKDKEETKKFEANKKGLVEFKNVCFRYPDADTEILEDINFTAKPGETTAIIGSTGSGKSTIVNLLPRFYDVTGGELLIDGVNVKEMPQKELRDIIGLVPQKGILFSGTIEANIKYSDENMSDEKMIEAAEIAQATEFIEAKEEKYKAPIAQGGGNVSGGQKQRLSIARAIAKDPEIFVFDDSFSALDFKTDSKLREALSKKTQDKTVIIVAQRISTILNAEQIIVLEEGKVVGIGTHEELMENNETYRQIALSQLSEEELNAKKDDTKNEETKNEGKGGISMPGPMGGPGRAPTQKPKNFKETTKKLIKQYLAKYRLALIIVFIFAIGSTIFTIVGPKILGNATTEIFNGLISKLSGGAGIDFGKIGKILLTLLGLYIVSALFSFIQGFTMTSIAQKITYKLRNDIAIKINKLPMNYFDKKTHGEVLSIVTNDVDTLSMNLNQTVTQIITAICTIIGILVMMLSISWQMTLISIIILPISAFIVKNIVGKSQKYFKKQQDYLAHVNGQVEEIYSGLNIVKAFNGEKKAEKEFKKANNELYRSGWRSQFLSGLMHPIMNFIANAGYVGVAVAGGYLAIQGTITVGNIQSFIQYNKQFTHPIGQIAQISAMLQAMVAAAERVFEFLEQPEEIETTKGNIDTSKLKGNVEFKNVHFGYDANRTIINDFNAKVHEGQKIAIVGPTGAGKTTMVKLLMRFYDVNSGEILVDGHNVKDFDRGDLRKMFGMVLQDTWLFGGTVKENLKYGNETATDDEVIEAAKAAHVHHFIKTLPNGYNSVLNEESSNVSAGQKQLLTIARVILADPKILILDEATSSIDTRTEIQIQAAMDHLMEGRTSFIIAHRLSTIKNADLILVMNHGDIVEQGTHEELLAKDGFYADLYNSQFEDCNDEIE